MVDGRYTQVWPLYFQGALLCLCEDVGVADDPEEGEEWETAGQYGAVELDAPHTGRHGGTSQQDGHSLWPSHRAATTNNQITSFPFLKLQFLFVSSPLDCVGQLSKLVIFSCWFLMHRYQIEPLNWGLYLPGWLMGNSFKWKRRCHCQAPSSRHHRYAKM